MKNGFQANLSHYGSSLQVGAGQVYDPLIWNVDMNSTPLRKFEIAAVAPDLFDISYYSIEPNYGKTYYPKLKENATKFGFTGDAIPRMDLGAREDVDELNGFSVQDQMALAGAVSVAPSGGLKTAPIF